MKYAEYQFRAELIKGLDMPPNWWIPDSYNYLVPFDHIDKRAAMERWTMEKRTIPQAQRDAEGIKPPVMYHVGCLDTLLYKQTKSLEGMRTDDIGHHILKQCVEIVLHDLRMRRCDIIIWTDHKGIPGPVDDIEPYIRSDGVVKFGPILHRGEWLKDGIFV